MLKCNDDNCLVCSSATACTICNDTFAVQSGTNWCEKCHNPCYKCSSLSATACTSCLIGYYLSGSTCPNCPPLCSSCTNASLCLTCKDNSSYLNTIGNTTATCTSCPANCSTCTYNDSNATAGIGIGLGLVSCTSCLANYQLSHQYPYSC
mgnify:CR=1 FL=1